MNEEQLDEMFRELPRSVAPPQPAWPAVAMRIERGRRRPLLLRLATGMVVFFAGAFIGRSLGRVPVARPASSPFLAAVEVQRTGTAYVQAVSRLDAMIPIDDPVRAQAAEVAHTTLAAAERAVESVRQ